MYYEEIVIVGKLHWRNSPRGNWQELSQEQLTEKIERLRQTIVELKQENEEMR